MRLKTILAALAALICAGFAAPETASAFGYRERGPHGWDNVRTVNHWVYYPRYRHVYHADPYAYQYSPRGYYPYYGSASWVPAYTIRKRNHYHYHHWNVQAPRYRYHQSWGYPKYWHGYNVYGYRRYHHWHY